LLKFQQIVHSLNLLNF